MLDHQAITILTQRHYFQQILCSETFSRADQLRRLLRWLAERSLEATPTPPTEQEVGMAVLNRRDFDPQTDSLVRKEMSRLREKLDKYYSTEGVSDEVRLRSRGGYLLRFEWHRPPRLFEPFDPQRRCLLVLPIRCDGMNTSEHRQFLEELQLHLALDGRLELISPTTARRYSEPSGDVREFASDCGADLVLEGSTWKTEIGFHSILWMVNGQSGRASRPFRGSCTTVEELTETLARQVLASV